VKKLLLLLICIFAISLSGCMKEYPLSVAQTDIVAEYMAGLLLEHDKDYSPSLLSYQESINTNIEDTNPFEDEIPKPTEAANKDDIPVPTKVADKPVIPDKDNQNTLSEVIGDSNFNFKYTGYKLVNTYPEDEINRVFSLDPREGYQLLVVDFLIENITNEEQTIDLSKSIIQYQLDINTGTIYKPELALLENNLQYINMKVKPGDKIPAVLIFEVSKDIDMSKINLIISQGSKSKILEVK